MNEKQDNIDEPLAAAIKEQAAEEEKPLSWRHSLQRIVSGESLAAVLKNKAWLVTLVAVFALVNVSNRYSCQKDIMEIDDLQKRLQDARYKAFASESRVTEMCRESNVIRRLQAQGDSLLQLPTLPPYIIQVPNE